MRSKFAFNLILLIIFSYNCDAQSFEPCKRTDPQINYCLKNLLNNLFLTSKYGRSNPNNNVIKTNRIVIESSRDFLVKGSLDNVQIRGFENLHIQDVRSKLSNSRIDLKFHVPNLELKSNYELYGGGKILLFPFEAKGNNWIDMNGLTGIVKIKFTRVQNNNNIYIQIDKVSFDFNFKNARFKFVDRRSEFLGPILTEVVNSNPSLFINTLKSQINVALGETVKNIFQSLLYAPEHNYLID